MPWSCLIPTPLLHVTLLGCLLSPFVTAQQPPPWPETNDSYNSPMSTALIVMIIVFFTVGFISVYLRHVITCFAYHSSGRIRRGDGGGGGRAREPRRRGLDPTILNTFPTFFYSDVKIHRVGKTTPLECAVCLSEFDDNELLRLLPKCNHVFHPHCVDPWLASHVTCPVCRANLEIIISETAVDPTTTTTTTTTTTSGDDELSSSERPQPSDHQDHVVIEVVEQPVASGSRPNETMVKSPTQELLNGLNFSESGRIIRLPRSHSTGHSLVGDSDRFTLRLPLEVRNKLVNHNLMQNAIASPTPGLRASNSGWKLSMSPPFIISRPNSPKLVSASLHYTPNNRSSSNNNNISGPSPSPSPNRGMGPGSLLRSPRSIFRSLKSPSNKSPLHRVVSCNDIGERSSNRLWDNQSLQHLDLEPHTHN